MMSFLFLFLYDAWWKTRHVILLSILGVCTFTRDQQHPSSLAAVSRQSPLLQPQRRRRPPQPFDDSPSGSTRTDCKVVLVPGRKYHHITSHHSTWYGWLPVVAIETLLLLECTSSYFISTCMTFETDDCRLVLNNRGQVEERKMIASNHATSIENEIMEKNLEN